MTLIKEVLAVKDLRIKYRSLKRESAYAQIEGKKVDIDLKNIVPPAKKYLHEAIHHVRPEWTEAQVSTAEGKEWKKLTHKQIKTLYQRMFK